MKALGIKYPIDKGQQGYFEQTYDTFTNEKVKLQNLMKTIEGERYYQPTFGLGLHKYLFEPITSDIKKKIELEIKNKISYWLPNLVINALYVDVFTDVDRNIINVEIDFSLKGNTSDYDVISFIY